MKLFLTSAAANVLDKIVPMLEKKPSDLKVLFIPTAGDLYRDRAPWLWTDRNKLVALGFKVKDFDIRDKSEGDIRKTLSQSDIIFVAGGNTFYLLQKAIESGFYKIIKEFISSDKIYIGSSAGSCIAGPDLAPIAPVDDPEKAKLDSTEAFGLVDFVVLPHHGNEKYDEIHERIIKEFKDKYKIVTLTDDQMIVVSGRNYTIE